MTGQCWATVYDAGPTLTHHWVNITCLLITHPSLQCGLQTLRERLPKLPRQFAARLDANKLSQEVKKQIAMRALFRRYVYIISQSYMAMNLSINHLTAYSSSIKIRKYVVLS